MAATSDITAMKSGEPAEATAGGRVLPHIVGLNGFRGFAVLIVIIFHAQGLRAAGTDPVKLLDAGWAGVDLFFVLSGFLITGILWRTKQHPRYWRNFAARRALRILPAYYLVLLMIALIPAFATIGSPSEPPQWVYPLFMSNFWVATSQGSLAYAITWSLAVEEQFYLVWPFVVRFVTLRRLAIISWVLVVSGPIIRLLLHDATTQISYMWTQCRLDSMAWGALAFIAWHTNHKVWIRRASRVAPVLAVTGTVAMAMLGDVRTDLEFAVIGYTVLSATAAGLILAVAAGELPMFTRWLRWRPLAHLGRVSFGAYLLHAPVIITLARTPIRGHLVAGIVASVVLTWTIATVMFRTVEEPMLSLKDRVAAY